MTTRGLPLLAVLSVALLATALTIPCVAEETVPLTSLDLESMSAGWGTALANRSIRNEPLLLDGKRYEAGVGTHADSAMRIRVGGATRFTALVGIDDSVIKHHGKGAGSVVFRVWGDGEKLFESDVMRAGDPPKPIDVNLTGKKTVLLEVTDAGDGIFADNANWVDAKFTVQGEKPKAVDPYSEGRVILTPKPGPVPKINGPRLFGVRPGRPFLYRIPCTGTRPIEFRVDSLPEGLQVDSKWGMITGTAPKAKGEYRMTFSAKNGHGHAEKEFTLVVGDTLSLTPQMGWNSWYIFYHAVTGKDMRDAADAMVVSGMADYGYMYVSIDDCWMKRKGDTPYRDENGAVLPNAKFPDMKGMVDYIHSHGLRAGTYISPGPWTCAGYVGSAGHERTDAEKFAEWGFDLLKYDLCSYGAIKANRTNTVAGLQKPYRQMGDILKTLDRDIVLNICEYGLGNVWEWGAEVGGNSWRTTGDLGLAAGSRLPGCLKIGLNNMRHWKHAGPGGWNDPDYLLIGYIRDARKAGQKQASIRCKLTGHEQYSYMSMWCLMAAPLFYSGDMTQLDDFTLNVLCNSEVLDVNQDALGKQAEPVVYEDDVLVLAKPMEDGSLAVGLFNLGERERTIKVDWKTLGLSGKQRVRDLWRQKELGECEGAFEASVARHGVVLVRMRGERD